MTNQAPGTIDLTPPAVHSRDEHCENAETLDDNDTCTVCGACSGDACFECGGERYHEAGCSLGGTVVDGVSGPRNERSLEAWLEEAIRLQCQRDGVGNGSVVTFVDAGVLTRNRGLVVRFGRSEFQISIVQSRRGR